MMTGALKHFFLLLTMFMTTTASYEEKLSSTNTRFLEPAGVRHEDSRVQSQSPHFRNTQHRNDNNKQILTSFRGHSDQESLDRPPGLKHFASAEEDRKIHPRFHQGSQTRTFQQQQPRHELPETLNYERSVDADDNNGRNYQNVNPSFNTQSRTKYQHSSLDDVPRKYERVANHQHDGRIPIHKEEVPYFVEEKGTNKPIKYASDGTLENSKRHEENKNIQGRIPAAELQYKSPVNDPYPSRNYRQFHSESESSLQPEDSGEFSQHSRHPSFMIRQPIRGEISDARVAKSDSIREDAIGGFPGKQYITDVIHRQSNLSARNSALDENVRRPFSENSYRSEVKTRETTAETEIDMQPAPSENDAEFSQEEHDGFLDMGAYTDKRGSFGWYADFPVGKGHDKLTYSFS
ncbi:uncharacterized protein LOC118181268 [Stegodyphus dumicola]|uniref:uncharacterized protein LOC118181268 n=1 Tax=Stegodyphus dumicola TaxID=202533 RepID=UPI0015AE3963|nr:uncharacterized protein LOC118181268 [Stegodyphus dumicola]